jgi:hypothetical protein
MRGYREFEETETRANMTIYMIPRERCDFSAIVDRPPLPGDARLAFWTIVNYEVWDISRPMARRPRRVAIVVPEITR